MAQTEFERGAIYGINLMKDACIRAVVNTYIPKDRLKEEKEAQ